jgi:hypothetical protein
MDRKKIKNKLRESRLSYDEGHNERMNSKLEDALRDRIHSLGDHPIFPDSDETNFEEKIMANRFTEVVKNYKRHFDVETVDDVMVREMSLPLLQEIMEIESNHKDRLQELAVKMIRDEYDISEDDMDIMAELVDEIGESSMSPVPVVVEDMDFDDHQGMVDANDGVYKRRFLNALSQGAARNNGNMYNSIDNDLMNMDARLPNKYNKIKALSDLLSFVVGDDESESMARGGSVDIQYPKSGEEKPIMHAKGLTFPALVHEMVCGVMNILSSHGLPEDKKIREYVQGKADFGGAEPWDIRLGTALWEKFTGMIDEEDMGLKHHIYQELASLPTKDFNETMREIMAGTKSGKNTISELCSNIKNEMQLDEYEAEINEMINTDDSMSVDDLNNIDFSDF